MTDYFLKEFSEFQGTPMEFFLIITLVVLLKQYLQETVHVFVCKLHVNEGLHVQ